MTDDRKILGNRGETAAVKFLQTNKFKILDRNYRAHRLEIDIIAKENDVICFIEVKTKRNTDKILPRESVNFTKQKKIIQAAQFYIKQKKCFNSRFRFDVIEAHEQNGQFDIHIIKNAFQAG